MDSEMEEYIFLLKWILQLYTLTRQRKRRFWTRELYLQRDSSGFFAVTFDLLKTRDKEQFQIATRMTSEVFDALLNMLREKLEKHSIRKPISPDIRLFLTLLYLSQGASRQYLSMTFKMSVRSVARIIFETCELIWTELSAFYLSTPNKHEWEKIADDFETIWNLPNCVGAIDGKHIAITCPPNSGSNFYNYKSFYSIILLAICDANYTFTAVDIGAYGSQSDGGVLSCSELGKRLIRGSLGVPIPRQLPNSDTMFNFYFVGDAAFPLGHNLMRPYPGTLIEEKRENFNKRLSRARRVIENSFGILTARWRILRGTMNMTPESAEKVVKATVVLHNFVKMNDGSYCPTEYLDNEVENVVTKGLWRKETCPLPNVRRLASNNSARSAFVLRDTLRDYLWENKI